MTSADIILAVMVGVSVLTSQAALFFALYVFLKDKKAPLVTWEELSQPSEEELEAEEIARKRANGFSASPDINTLRRQFEELIKQ